MDPLTALLLLGLGAVVGVLASLLGVGGGFLMVPALDELLRARGLPAEVSQRVAVATSLLAMTPTAMAAGWRQHRSGNVLVRAVVCLAPGAVMGAVAGAWFGQRLQADTLRGLLAGAMFLMGLKMLIEKKGEEPACSPDVNGAVFAGLGLITGVFSALTGLGGGVLTVPVMKSLGFRVHQAVGTSSAIIGLMALSGACAYGAQPVLAPPGLWLVGAVAPVLGLLIALSAIFATYWGVRWNNALPAARLKKLFGGFLLLLSTRVTWVMLHG